MQLRSMLRGEGFKGNENQTASELHSNGCMAFLNFLQASSVSIKQMVPLHPWIRKRPTVHGPFRVPIWEGLIYKLGWAFIAPKARN